MRLDRLRKVGRRSACENSIPLQSPYFTTRSLPTPSPGWAGNLCRYAYNLHTGVDKRYRGRKLGYVQTAGTWSMEKTLE